MSEMELLVAADLYGTKQNIKFVFPTRPTLKEFVAQVELAFQKEAVLRQPAGVLLQRFEVSNVQVHSEHAQSWVDVVRQGQLAHACQYYAFQLRGGGGAALRSASRDRRQRQEQQLQQPQHTRHTLRACSPQPRTPRGRAASRERGGGGTPRAGSQQQRRGPSATGRRSTSITDRASHHRDTRARLTRETQAARTLSNDQRYCAFLTLAPAGRLDHRCVEPLLLARGADFELARRLAFAASAMETGPDGCSSFAQFSREFRRHPKLFKTLAAFCAQPQLLLPGDAAAAAAAAALGGDGSASPLPPPLSPPLGLRVAASASPPPEAAVAPAPAMMAPPPPAAAAMVAPEAELWLEAEISRLEEDHRARIRQLHERYEALQPAAAAAVPPVALAPPPPAYGYGYEAAATAAAAEEAAAAAAAASAHTHTMMPGISPPVSPDGHVDAVYQQLADSLAAADVVRRL